MIVNQARQGHKFDIMGLISNFMLSKSCPTSSLWLAAYTHAENEEVNMLGMPGKVGIPVLVQSVQAKGHFVQETCYVRQ